MTATVAVKGLTHNANQISVYRPTTNKTMRRQLLTYVIFDIRTLWRSGYPYFNSRRQSVKHKLRRRDATALERFWILFGGGEGVNNNAYTFHNFFGDLHY